MGHMCKKHSFVVQNESVISVIYGKACYVDTVLNTCKHFSWVVVIGVLW